MFLCPAPLLIKTDCLIPVHSGYCAFTHKAGIHAKAILNNPSTYEILKPEDFGLTRYVSIGSVVDLMWIFYYVETLIRSRSFSHRLTGWNAVKSRVEQLGLTMSDDEVRRVSLCFFFSHYVIVTFENLVPDQGRDGKNQGTRRREDAVDG